MLLSMVRNLLNKFALFVITLLLVGGWSSYAQTANDILEAQNSLYNLNGNPYDTSHLEDEEGADRVDKGGREKRDSAKRSVVQPLESYFFNDSVRSRRLFAWSIDQEFNRIKMRDIDTALHDFHIDYPYYREGVGDMSLGGLGQASQAIDFSKRARYQDFSFAQVFDSYINTPENVKFYNVKSPFTQFAYEESGQKSYRESNFNIVHAQNITPSTGFSLDYKARSTKGLYQRQDTKNHNLALTASHTGRRYSIQGGYINNTIKTEENGGVVGLWTIVDSLFEMPIGVPMKLGDAEASNEYRNNTIFFTQAFGVPLERFDERDFSMANKSAFYIGHSFEYSTWTKLYEDTRADYTDDRYSQNADGTYNEYTGEYYSDWFINPTVSRDSIRERKLSNKLFIQAQPWGRDAIVATVDGGVGIDFYAYSQFGMDSYFTGELERDTRVSWYAYGSAEGKVQRYMNWRGHAKIHPSGYKAGDLEIGGELELRAYLRDRPLIVSGDVSVTSITPSYWYDNLFSNHYVYNNSFIKENSTTISAKMIIPSINLELGVTESIADNLIYFNNDSEITQASSAVSVLGFYGRKNFRLGGLNLDHRVEVQSSSDQAVAPVPLMSAFLSYYYQFWVVNNVLRLQLGVDCRYTSAYAMPDYNPALSTFFNQTEEELGDYPYMDVYATAKWKRMRIILKYQHLNDGLFGNREYFSVANYPMNPGMFKIGFSWAFYD